MAGEGAGGSLEASVAEFALLCHLQSPLRESVLYRLCWEQGKREFKALVALPC